MLMASFSILLAFPFRSCQAVPPPFQEGRSRRFFGEGVSSAPAWAAVMDGAGRAVQSLLPVTRSSSNRPGLQVVHQHNVIGVNSIALVSVPLDGVGFTQEGNVGIKRIPWASFVITLWTW